MTGIVGIITLLIAGYLIIDLVLDNSATFQGCAVLAAAWGTGGNQ